ncbi:RNA polymerase Rpb7 N-terminal domain-containing protein [Striga hermonthica]|uniref:DNA-directed RNA polymerase subunit n=1 Tax=Striga hermonthica TaxID=68872 RepID=A0A9N7ND95_STRHE|nr:RNA polymerase Rpb7 N-terminal domain-containing protein [Striga hermonthica]
MFFLSKFEHTLRFPPHLLSLSIDKAISGELESLFLDKVIQDLGLCVSLYDIQSINGGFVYPGDGASTYTVVFRLVMFRPFVGEVISARLMESTKDGLRLSLGFFEDVYVPVPCLNSPNHSEPDPTIKGGVKWVWEYEGENYPIDGEDEIRFKVLSVSYPPIPLDHGDASENDTEQKVVKPVALMVVTGTIDADGLGPISWWV